jgi:hypothetical protein
MCVKKSSNPFQTSALDLQDTDAAMSQALSGSIYQKSISTVFKPRRPQVALTLIFTLIQPATKGRLQISYGKTKSRQ